MVVVISTEEERIECLKSVADSIIVAMELAGLPPAPLSQGPLEKRKSKMPEIHSGFIEASGPEDRKSASKVVSNSLKALSNVTTHFSKLNPMSKFRTNKNNSQAASAGEVERGVEALASLPASDVPLINIDSQS